MRVSLDAALLQRHLDLLHEELRVAKYLEELIETWYKSALSIPETDPSVAYEQLCFSRKEITNILHRISLLESIEEKTFRTTTSMEKRLTDAADQLSYFEEFLI